MLWVSENSSQLVYKQAGNIWFFWNVMKSGRKCECWNQVRTVEHSLYKAAHNQPSLSVILPLRHFSFATQVWEPTSSFFI